MPIPSLLIIYDGACPFCSAYVALLRLRAHFKVELLSARSDDARILHYRGLGYRLDEGMLVVLDDVVHVGPDAMHMLATLSEPSGVINRLQRGLFGSHRLSRWLYPGLKVGRRIALWFKHVPLIDAAKEKP